MKIPPASLSVNRNLLVRTLLAKVRFIAILPMAVLAFLTGAVTYGATTITSVPFAINKSGTYVMKTNLTLSGTGESAISVNVSNVVVDLGGFDLATSDTTFSNSGITVQVGVTNVTIQNGLISNFETAVNLLGPEEIVQNLRCESAGNGIACQNTCTSSLIQNCLVAGNGTGVGVGLSGSADVVVKNNQIVSESTGGYSAGNNSFIANYIGSCVTGLSLSSTDKYQGNVTTLCATPFSGGIEVGTENN
jgi:hypothetical protein